MSNKNKTNPSFDALHKTISALKEIRTSLIPFIQVLKDDGNGSSRNKSDSASKKKKRSRNDNINCNDKQLITPQERAEAKAAVALAIGTLRYMGNRLKGKDEGRKKGDPLRMELDNIRGLLVQLRKLEKKDDSTKVDKKETPSKDMTSSTEKKKDTAKRKATKEDSEAKKDSTVDDKISPSKKKKQKR